MYDLEGKVALVTGAGGEHGIGRSIATRLAGEGADVIVSDIVLQPYTDTDTGWRGLPDLVREIRGLGRHAVAILADVADSHSVDEMVCEGLEKLGRLDILVNNAASPPGRDRVPVIELEEDAWDKVQQINVKGTFLCCRAVARAMIEQGTGGKIINISSISGKRGVPRFAAYCASKFAVLGFTQALALELAPYRINVNAICPGSTETERLDAIAAALAPAGTSAKEHREAMLRSASATVPLGRAAYGSDVAAVAAFLAASESDYLTGLSISVAGGLVMY
jgi:NAD(P)-dependent dehydrogenase (short-subunit alcohol dehydrogenase family)